MRYNHLIIRTSLIVLAFTQTLPACKKWVTVDPPVNALNSKTVFSDDADAGAALNGIYIRIMSDMPANGTISGGPLSIGVLAALSADELSLYPGADPNIAQVYTNAQTAQTNIPVWNNLYSYIFYCNSAIEGLGRSTGLTKPVKDQLTGEAKFVRAFCFFNLVNLYGDVPMPLTADYESNSSLGRTAREDVYNQIVLDLKDAAGLLPAAYSDRKGMPTNERTRPNKFAAAALLARVYLYEKDWRNAETQATLLIDDIADYDTVALNDVFLKNSREAIWQLQPVIANYNSYDGDLYILMPGRPNAYFNAMYLSDQLTTAFESGDKRRDNWVGTFVNPDPAATYYYPNKYKLPYGNANVSEYQMVLRLAEQYLIRAEARAQQDNLAGATADVNVIRSRAGLPDFSPVSKDALIDEIFHERQVELFTECGHRWFDLIRSEKVDAVMNAVTPVKSGAPWNSSRKLFPVRQEELNADPNLSQTPGY